MNSLSNWIAIGNPENRRIHLFQKALASHGQPPPCVLSYLDLLVQKETLAKLPPNAIVRIDSPGENFEVEKQLLLLGRDAAEAEGSPILDDKQIKQMEFDRGLIINPRQWYLGFVSFLLQLQGVFTTRPDLHLCNSTNEIMQMFDKVSCHEMCRAAGIPVPRRLSTVACFDDLVETMERENLRRVFIKLAHGSSASGVVALHRGPKRFEAITSTEMVRGTTKNRLYNSLKIRCYNDLDDIRTLIETLLPHRVHIEQWLPKAVIGRRVFDLRVVVIGGQVRQMVVRTSRTPLTNLHLGNRRGDLVEFKKIIPSAEWAKVQTTCELAANCFPNSLQLGLDILFTPGFRKHFLLEANAFGDLLPNLLSRGQDCYESQIAAVMAKFDSEKSHVPRGSV